MGIDPLGAALGSASLFFVVYDTCSRLYQGCQDIRYFGRDVILESMKIRNLMSDLDIIMETKATDMQEPPDLDDAEHRVTKEIIRHLRIISTYFQACNDIIQDSLRVSQGVPFMVGSTTLGSSRTTRKASELSIKVSNPPASKTPGMGAVTDKSKKHFGIPSLLARRSSKQRTEVRAGSPLDQTSNQISSNAPQAAICSPLNSSAATSGLKLPCIHVVSSEDAETQQAWAGANWWTLLKWTDHDRLRLKSSVEDLRTAIHDFRDYIELRRPIHPGAVLALPSEIVNIHRVPHLDPAMLRELHVALRRVNSSASAGSKVLSLSIVNSCQDNRDVLGEFPGMAGKLRRDSRVTFLQKHDDGASCTFLAIESGAEPLEGAQVRVIDDLSAVRCPDPADLVDSDRYVQCGNVAPLPEDEFHHELFAEIRPWQCVQSLSEYLDDSASAALLSLEVIVKLFRAMLLAYLDFEKLRGSCRYPRLEDYRTYQRPSYTSDSVLMQNASEQPWENPYWACGLGSPGPIRTPGASRQTVAPDEPVVRLGLVLFQLASRSKDIMAAAPGGVEKNWLRLQSEALRALHNVQAVCGVAVGAVVEACLLSNAQTERKTLCECLVKLNKIEAEF
ncbi:hypothetical protein CKM354_001137600 [Cercospora kikuchii]|uniref:Uncharacterized protein n=1 Tax=Cercospora kikuchii TaxID=84275 RepID=A0A9P3CPE8_9PEZI|nr:uncharacterized protein CKM354_001137600 [Cercospora kikuchii]GIZ48309.1 hypothetical protein CKM354_001137600 [Cercospora kikuchii]